MRTVSMKLPDWLDGQLAKAARRLGRSKSALVRDALEAYFNGAAAPGRRSCLDLAGSLAGSLKGPRDLSSGRKHMRGYGG